MSWVDDIKKRAGLKKRDIDDDETDVYELKDAGITVDQARRKTGVRKSNMTDDERSKLVKWRTMK